MPPSASVRSSALRAALIAGVVIAVVVALAGSTAAAPTTVVECRTLQEPGTYELAGDLLQEITGNLTTGSCLVIDSPNVTLLGNGHAVSGSGSASVGVEVRAHQNVTVSNLTVEGFDSVGVWATGTTGFEARNLSVNATGTGLKIEDGDAPTLTQVRVSNATGVGIAVFNTTNATASDILTRSNQGAGVGLRNTSDATVRGLDSRADGMGVNVTDSAQVTVRNATVRNPASQGIRAVASPDALLADNTVRGAGLAGILVRDAAARLERNVVREGIRGVVLDAANGSVSLNDTATGTLDGAGLFVDGARNVTVRGFNTTGNLVGVSVQNANTTRLDGVLAQQNDLEGIVVHASTATLTDVIARGNGVGGVRVVAGSAGSGSNLTVRQNPVGLWLQSSPDWVTEGVVAADNGGSGSAVRVTGAPGTVRGLELVNGTLDVGNRTLDLRARGIALGVDAPPPDAPAAHRYLGSALEVQNVSGGASAWLNASAAWSPAEVDAYQVEEPRWQRWNGTAWETVSGFNRAFPTDRRVVANATEFGVLAPLVRDDVTPPDATVRVNGTRGDNGWWITPPEVRVNATDAYAGVASRELRVDGNWISITDPVTLDEGVTVVRGRATDLAGLSELTDNRTVRVDIEPPRTNATAPTGWVNRTANVTLTASDAISGVNRTTWRLDDGDLRTYEGSVRVETEGIHEIRYRSHDLAGIRERIRNVTVRVDRTVPVVEASVSGNRTSDGEFANAATVEVNASDALAGLNLTWVRVDGGPWRTYDGPIHVNATGNHTVTAAATDLAGNRELALANFTVVDLEPPNTTLLVDPSMPDGENGWYQTRPEFRLEPTLENATPQYRIDDGELQTYDGPVQVPEGNHTITYRSTHPIRPNELFNETQFRVDIEPPRTNATAPTGWVNRTVNVTLTASDAISGVNRTTWRLDDGDLRTYEGSVRVETEGIHEIRYRSHDLAGIRERIRNVTVRVDRTVPVVEASVSGNRTSDGEFVEAATVEVNASDALAGLNLTRVRVDGGPWRTYDGPIHVNATGNHTVTAAATDLAGNRELAVVQFTVGDREPPSTRLIADPSTPDGENGWYQTRPEFRLEPTPENATPQYRIDDGELQTYESPVQVPEGNHTIAYRSVHPIRPNESFNETQFRVDRTVPVVEASVSGDRTSNGEFANAATVEVNASDALAGLNLTRVRVDGGAWRTYDGPIHVNATGNHTVTAATTDLAGNRELAVVEFTVVDLEPPTTSLLVDPSTPDGENGWYQTRPEFRLEPTPENATPEYRLDDDAFQVYKTPVQIPEGIHTVAYRSTHPIRPNESVKEAQFRVDTEPPRTNATAPAGWVNRTANVTLTASDATSGVNRTTWRLNDGDLRTYEGSVRVELEGIHEIRYRSRDLAGNRERERNVTVRIDRTAPVVEASVSGNRTSDGEFVEAATVEVNASDALAGLNRTRVRVDGGAWRTYDGPIHVNATGNHTVTVEATDIAGNRERTMVEFTVACPDGEVYRDGACEPANDPASEPRVEVQTQDGNTVVVAVENVTGGDIRLVAVHPNGSEEPVGTGQSATWNTSGFENGRYRIEARNETNVTVASASYLIERARVSTEAATFAVGLGVVLSALVQSLSIFSQSFSVLGQSTTGLSGRVVRFVDLVVRVVRRILSIEYREYTKDTATIRRVRQTLAVGVAGAALASASTLAGFQPWTLSGFLSNLPTLGGAALLFSGVWYGGDWLVGQLIDEDPEYVLLGSGMVSLLATTILFRSPFGTPGYVDRSSDTPASGSVREREEAIRALADLGLVAVAALAFLPAMRLWIYGFGETGLLLVVMTLSSGSVPVPPLPNYRVWRWNKPAGLCVFALGIVLYVSWQLAVLPDALVVGVGLGGVVAVSGFVNRERRRRDGDSDRGERDAARDESDSDRDGGGPD